MTTDELHEEVAVLHERMNDVLSPERTAATDAPSNASIPAGWIKITVGGAAAWLPYYQ